MQRLIGTLLGKIVGLLLSYRSRGGHALPGLIVENLFPSYLSDMLKQLPEGVVVVSGTNGKTTTTKMLVEVLRSNNKKVITNTTGSNLTRGIASSLIKNASLTGKLHFDIAVLEIDEATLRPFTKNIKPKWVLALNVSRDQLDRYGEIDTIAKHIEVAMAAAKSGVITNADDPQLVKVSRGLKNISYFGVSSEFRKYFPNDYEMASVKKESSLLGTKRPNTLVELKSFKDQKVEFDIQGQKYTAKLKLKGQHNFLNAVAALALLKQLLPGVDTEKLIFQLSEVSIAFGRGELYRMKNGSVVELVLVKNPASFQQALASYATKANNLMVAINDNIADGRDVSWLWDIDFSSLSNREVIVTSGQRAADMALRLSYDDVKVGSIEPGLYKSLNVLSKQKGTKVIIATYTAMLNLYSWLNRHAERLE